MKPITWEMKIPFFKNTYLLRSIFMAYLAAMLLTSIIIASIFILSGDGGDLVDVAFPMLGVYAFIFVLMFLSSWIVIGNKYALAYQVDHEGVLITGTKDKAKDIRKMAIIAGVLTANPGVAGAGLLARENVIFIPWEDMDEVVIDEDRQRVVIKCNYWTQVAVHMPSRKAKQILAVFDTYLVDSIVPA